MDGQAVPLGKLVCRGLVVVAGAGAEVFRQGLHLMRHPEQVEMAHLPVGVVDMGRRS
jgi:hypothetical protein